MPSWRLVMDFKFPNTSRMVPESLLSYRCEKVGLRSVPNDVGIELERLFLSSLKEMRDFESLFLGKWSLRFFSWYAERWLLYICNNVSFSKFPILEGIGPVRLLLFMSSSTKLGSFPDFWRNRTREFDYLNCSNYLKKWECDHWDGWHTKKKRLLRDSNWPTCWGIEDRARYISLDR